MSRDQERVGARHEAAQRVAQAIAYARSTGAPAGVPEPPPIRLTVLDGGAPVPRPKRPTPPGVDRSRDVLNWTVTA